MKKEYTYHSMHMHIHTCFQPGMSMAAQMYNAKTLNMHYIWLTDHDTRTGFKQNPVNGFIFDSDALIKHDGENSFYGFEVADFEKNAKLDYDINTDKKTIKLTALSQNTDEWQSAGIFFVSSRTRHTHSLLMQVGLEFKLLDETICKDSRLIFDVRLSQRPPHCNPAHLLYVIGSTEGLSAPNTQIIPLSIKDNMVVLPLSDDVSNDDEIGGIDNVFDTITITLQARKGTELSVLLKDFVITVGKGFEDAHEAQKHKAAEIGEHYNVTPFVSYEISGAGEHKNCFTTSVPTIDYQKYNYAVSPCEAARHVKKHGGIFAFNHPLAIQPLKRKKFTPEQKLSVIAKMTANLLANRAYGADLLEVGFPTGRNGFSSNEFLLLWDMLSCGGMFLCGYGSSDCHRDNVNWYDGNNFATYLGVESNLSHPVSEENFIEAMKKGRAYSGNPVKLRGKITFETKDGHQQGTVFDTQKTKSIDIVFNAKETKPGWKFRLIENGLEAYSEIITSSEFTYNSILQCREETVNFQRVELYDENGICIMLTNPIYLVNTELFCGEIPSYRLPEGDM